MKYLKTFELIEAVVRAGSIRKAAEDTNLTASALNRRIQKFDQAFDGLINDAQARPHAEIRLNKRCMVMQSRQLIWDEDGNKTAIHDLGPDLETIIQETIINPEQKFTLKPNDAMPGNPRIALVDTGVNYTLPAFWPNVAVDKSGRLVGYDFWDDDPWPFDSDLS